MSLFRWFSAAGNHESGKSAVWEASRWMYLFHEQTPFLVKTAQVKLPTGSWFPTEQIPSRLVQSLSSVESDGCREESTWLKEDERK